jgi:hypothetical protein
MCRSGGDGLASSGVVVIVVPQLLLLLPPLLEVKMVVSEYICKQSLVTIKK